MALFVVLLAGFGLRRGFLDTGDTQNLVAGAKVAVHCAAHGPWRSCGRSADGRSSAVGPYPLLQYLPAGALRAVGVGPAATVRALAWISLASFVVLLGLLTAGARRAGHLWPPLVLLLAGSGPLLFYATSAFGEMLAATVVLGAVGAARARRPVLLLVMAALACLSKETLPPFVLVLGLLAGRDADDGLLPPARVVGPLLAGVATGTAGSLAFNVFRFGSVRNVTYLAPALNVTAPRQVAINALGLVAAPGGGLAPFWPSLVLFVAGFVVATVGAARLARSRGRSTAVAAHLTVLATGAAFTLALATWWSPFGWVAWGPRLLVPLVPALVVVAIGVGAAPFARIVGGALRPVLAAAVIAVVCLVGAFPEASAPWVATRAAHAILVPAPACTQHWPPGDPHYWRCFDQRAWRVHDTPLRTAAAAGGGLTWGARIVLLIGLAALLVEARRRAADGPLSPDRC